MASRYTLDEALSRIMHDSDSGSELEMSENDSSDTESSDAETVPATLRDPSPPDTEEQPGPSTRRAPTRGRVRGRARGRGRGRGRGMGRGRGQNNQPPEFECRNVDFLDYFDDDWLGTPRRQGVLVDTSEYKPVDYFKYFFPDEVFDIMTTNTNLYATQFLENRNLGTFSRYHKWTDTTAKEMQTPVHIALQIAMGINNKPEIPDYWSTYWLTAGKFCDVMSRNRYQLLNTFLHFNDNSERRARGEEGYDPLFKVRTLMNCIDPRYLSAYAPDKELSIDESMIKFKGRIFFRQYLPAKPTKWGIKTFTLCESNTGYGLKFMVYTGKNTFQVDRTSSLSITEQTCLAMTEGFENNGYELYMDNYYTSPQLFSELKSRGIGAAGTVKYNRKYMPYDLQPTALVLNKGDDPVFMCCQDLITCAMMDTKRVHFLSSVHSDNTFDKTVRDRNAPGGTRTVVWPVICEAYNQHMNGVDVLDQKLGSYSYPHKCAKWYMTIYHRYREVALVNGYILYTKGLSENSKAMSVVSFREEVIDGLLEGWEIGASKRGRPSVTEKPDRLTGRHFPAQYDDPKHRPECVVCSDRVNSKRVQTRFYYRNGDKAMCPTDCFMLYHTQKDFRTAFRNNYQN